MDLLQAVDPTGAGSTSADPYRPSFFELAAQEQLSDLLKPAVRYTLAVLAQRNPRYLIRILNRFDEVYALVMLAVERHYLSVWGSSFAENFYGLRRRRRPGVTRARSKPFGARAAATSSALAHASASTASGQASSEALRPRDVRVSLLFLVALPYAQTKLHDWWEAMGGSVDAAAAGGADLFADEAEEQAATRTGARWAGDPEASRIERLRELFRFCFKRGYPYLGAAWQLWLLSYHVAYLFDRTPYWRPWLQAMRVDIRRVGADDYPETPPLLPPDLPNPLRHPLAWSWSMVRSTPHIAFETLKYALPASIFLFKFLEWWYSPDNPRRRRGGGGANAGGGGGRGTIGGVGSLAAGGAGEALADVSGIPLFGPPKVLLPHPRGCAAEPRPHGKGVEADDDGGEFKRRMPRVALSLPAGTAPRGAVARRAAAGRAGSGDADDDDDDGVVSSRRAARLRLVHNSCALCGATPVQAPALLPTGYVLCYTCAFAYVERHGACPVTRFPIVGGTSEIRRVLA